MTDDSQRYCAVMTTCATKNDAERIAREILDRRLGACVQMLEIRSMYIWRGEVADEPEVLVVVKTRADMYDELESLIRKTHPYEIPEIVQVPIERGLPQYLRWIDESLRG
jgi:periplasmic divalent cation tolerance protein